MTFMTFSYCATNKISKPNLLRAISNLFGFSEVLWDWRAYVMPVCVPILSQISHCFLQCTWAFTDYSQTAKVIHLHFKSQRIADSGRRKTAHISPNGRRNPESEHKTWINFRLGVGFESAASWTIVKCVGTRPPPLHTTEPKFKTSHHGFEYGNMTARRRRDNVTLTITLSLNPNHNPNDTHDVI